MKTYSFIINPYAGKGRGRKLLPQIRKQINYYIPDAEIILTEKRLHAYELSRERKDEEDRVVIAVGGDGTVNEVGNGLIDGAAYMSVVPIGSGNDFIKMFSIPLNTEEAIKKILQGTPQSFDVGLVNIKEKDNKTTERYFLNGIGIGFDAAVANQTTKYKRLKGFSLYIAAVAHTLFNFSTPNMMMSVNGMNVNGQHFLIAVGNGKCAGGGFYLTPEADINDGLLDICLVDNISIPQVLKIFPSVLKGKHSKYSQVHFYKSDALQVEAQDDIMVHADGEVIATSAREIEIKIKPAALSIIC